jgi:hypothetical protein
MELGGLEPPTSWVRSTMRTSQMRLVCREFIRPARRSRCRRSSAICEIWREIWHVTGSACQNQLDAERGSSLLVVQGGGSATEEVAAGPGLL